MRLAALALAAGCVLAACRGAPAAGEAPEGAPAAVPVLVGVDPAFLPALEALRDATLAGEDEAARTLLARLLARGPQGRALEIASAFRTVLDGRAAVGATSLRLECRPDDAPPGPGVPAGARRVRVFLVAETAPHAPPLELRPGPATLRVTREDADRGASVSAAAETRSFEGLGTLALAPGRPVELPLLRCFLAPGPSHLAVRLSFDLDLRAGHVTVLPPGAAPAPRALPAQRLRVAPAEAYALAGDLEGLAGARPDELVLLACGARTPSPRAGLELAVRIGPGDREQALERLAEAEPRLSEAALAALAPALRWISGTGAPGGDPAAWRAWLRSLGKRAAREEGAARPRLLLPAGAGG